MQRKQQEGESVQDFTAALQKLSLNCELGEYTKTELRNYFSCVTTSLHLRTSKQEDAEQTFGNSGFGSGKSSTDNNRTF